MLRYDGYNQSSYKITKGPSYGLAVDQLNRILYFTDGSNDKLYKVTYRPTSFNGPAVVILAGDGHGQVGDGPTGLIVEGNTLYWILLWTAEIRSMTVSDNRSRTVIPAAAAGVRCYYLAKKGQDFYYTRWSSPGGVYRVTEGGERQMVNINSTLKTAGIIVV
jgi:hypothetical protein